jgi:hypothetical protein
MKAYKLYELEAQKTTTGVHVRFSENEVFGQKTPIDEYLVTQDDEEGEGEGRPTASTVVELSPPTTPTAAPQHDSEPPTTTRYFRTPEQATSKDDPKSHFRNANSAPPTKITDVPILSRHSPFSRHREPTGMALRPRDNLRPPTRDDNEGYGEQTPARSTTDPDETKVATRSAG